MATPPGKDSDRFRLARNGFERGALNISHLMGKEVCFAIAGMFARDTNSILITAPLKDIDGQQEKVFKTVANEGYDGEWSRIKDVVRTTILIKDKDTFDSVAKRFKLMEGASALNQAIQQLWSQGFNQQRYKNLSAHERDMIASGNWEMLGGFKSKDGARDGYTDASMVLQYNTKHSVGGAGQAAAPTRAEFGPSQGMWVQTVRVEIQINTPDMIYGKQFEKDFLSMISAPHGPKLFGEVRQKTSIFAGLGHVFYEVSRKDVLVAETRALSKRYYEYIRTPSPGSSVFVSLCRDVADYFTTHAKPIRQIVEAKNQFKLPGEGASAGGSMLHIVGLNHPSLGAAPPSSGMQQNSPGTPQAKVWNVNKGKPFRSGG